MAASGKGKRKFSVKRIIAISTGILLSGSVIGGIALVTAQSGTGSRYSLDELRQQVLSMRPQAFEAIEEEEEAPEGLHTSLKKRYSYSPRTLPDGRRLVGQIVLSSLPPNVFPGPNPDDQWPLTPVSGLGFDGENLGVHTTLGGDFSVKGFPATIGEAANVPLTDIASVLGGGNPREKIKGIVDDILGRGSALPGAQLKRSAETAFLLSGAGDGFPDSEDVEFAQNSEPQYDGATAEGLKTPAANGVPSLHNITDRDNTA